MSKSLMIALGLGLSTLAGAAVAQTAVTSAATTSAPADKGLSVDSPIVDIAAHPEGKKVLDANLPMLTTHEAYESFKGMSLKELQPLSGGVITDEALTKIAADLAKLS